MHTNYRQEERKSRTEVTDEEIGAKYFSKESKAEISHLRNYKASAG